MFYDFETTQNTGKHIVNWVDCQDFEGKMYQFSNIERNAYTFIAHNAKAFDAQFILKYCIEISIKPYCIYSGSKIISMEVKTKDYKIRFIDSINFVAGALSSFPKMFGLKELKKGYFPHLFNKPCHQKYVGKIPSKKHYCFEQMKSKDREAFLKWYKERVDGNYLFDFEKELIEYCRSDVDILRRSMIKFRENFIELENIDPFCYTTILQVYVWLFIKETIFLKIQ